MGEYVGNGMTRPCTFLHVLTQRCTAVRRQTVGLDCGQARYGGEAS